jgi:hypothetical protein
MFFLSREDKKKADPKKDSEKKDVKKLTDEQMDKVAGGGDPTKPQSGGQG